MSSMKNRGGKADKKKGAAPEPVSGSGEKGRYQKMFEAMAAKAPPSVKPYAEKAAPVLAQVAVAVQIAIPYIIQGATMASEFVAALPEKALHAAIGFLMCFFGGIFPATIAAYEAWALCGGKEALQSLKDILNEAGKAKDAVKEDDEKDEDKNGVKDVDEISGQALLARRAKLVLKTVDSATLNRAIAQIWTGWVGVLAALKIQFAKTVMLGEVIGEKIYMPAQKYAEPVLLQVAGEEFKQWVPTGLKWACKAVAICIAWWVQRVISAIHSAIRGGLIFGKFVVEFAVEKGYLKKGPEDSYMDEAVGWAAAAVGLLFQITMGFRAPFPLNILLFPVSIVEYVIVWSVAAN